MKDRTNEMIVATKSHISGTTIYFTCKALEPSVVTVFLPVDEKKIRTSLKNPETIHTFLKDDTRLRQAYSHVHQAILKGCLFNFFGDTKVAKKISWPPRDRAVASQKTVQGVQVAQKGAIFTKEKVTTTKRVIPPMDQNLKPICEYRGLHDKSNTNLWVVRSVHGTDKVFVYPETADIADVKKHFIRATGTKYDDARPIRLKSYLRQAK